jgi:hypothetical protein
MVAGGHTALMFYTEQAKVCPICRWTRDSVLHRASKIRLPSRRSRDSVSWRGTLSQVQHASPRDQNVVEDSMAPGTGWIKLDFYRTLLARDRVQGCHIYDLHNLTQCKGLSCHVLHHLM